VIKHWSHDLERLDTEACRELARGEAINRLMTVLPIIEEMGTAVDGRAPSGRTAAAGLRRAVRQGVPQMIVNEALQVCRVVRNEIVHGLKLSTRVPDREVMIGSCPVVRRAAELGVRLGSQNR
jgi:hypothetical protein